tara:strand:+ start:2228 stop:2653 length:426 start_codon:yes stop_codon:yes gene_type:complete
MANSSSRRFTRIKTNNIFIKAEHKEFLSIDNYITEKTHGLKYISVFSSENDRTIVHINEHIHVNILSGNLIHKPTIELIFNNKIKKPLTSFKEGNIWKAKYTVLSDDPRGLCDVRVEVVYNNESIKYENTVLNNSVTIVSN